MMPLSARKVGSDLPQESGAKGRGGVRAPPRPSSCGEPALSAIAPYLNSFIASAPTRRLRSPAARDSGCFETEERLGEGARLERAEVPDAFADAERDHRDAELPGERDDHAAPCRTVQLGHDQPRDRHHRAEGLDLGARVLPGG